MDVSQTCQAALIAVKSFPGPVGSVWLCACDPKVTDLNPGLSRVTISGPLSKAPDLPRTAPGVLDK